MPLTLKGQRMPQPGVALEKLGFLTIGLFDGDNPAPGHQATLETIALGERLGFDSAWVRHRHLQYGIPSTVDVLSGGRLNPGVSVGPPTRFDDVRSSLYPGTADAEDFSFQRVARLLR